MYYLHPGYSKLLNKFCEDPGVRLDKAPVPRLRHLQEV